MLFVTACSSNSDTTEQQTSTNPVAIDSAASTKAVASNALQRDALVLLVPDGANESDWPIKVWADTATDEGYRLQIVTDSTFMAMGVNASKLVKALILPDSAHPRASDALIAAITAYVNGGGNLMLTYDAGVLTDTGFYAPGKSRFSALAGVDYAMYDTLLDQMVGLGSVVGTKDRLTTLNFPPGKCLPAHWRARRHSNRLSMRQALAPATQRSCRARAPVWPRLRATYPPPRPTREV
jgi:hypothetical protein